MEKVRPWCGQPSDRGRLKIRSDQHNTDDQQQTEALSDSIEFIDAIKINLSVCLSIYLSIYQHHRFWSIYTFLSLTAHTRVHTQISCLMQNLDRTDSTDIRKRWWMLDATFLHPVNENNFLWHSASTPANGISDGSAALAQLMTVTNRHIHRPCHICNNRPHLRIMRMRCGLIHVIVMEYKDFVEI